MKIKQFLYDWIIPIGVAIILAALINKFLFFQARVPSESMYPTIKIGDRMIVTRVHDKSKLKRGDIVVFYSRELKDTLIKRLVGLPGDKVEVKSNGEVYVNDQKINEPYVVYNDNLAKTFNVPANKYLFFGDNRPVSDDARRWINPYIDAKDIQGKAQFLIYPFSRFGKFVVGQQALSR